MCIWYRELIVYGTICTGLWCISPFKNGSGPVTIWYMQKYLVYDSKYWNLMFGRQRNLESVNHQRCYNCSLQEVKKDSRCVVSAIGASRLLVHLWQKVCIMDCACTIKGIILQSSVIRSKKDPPCPVLCHVLEPAE